MKTTLILFIFLISISRIYSQNSIFAHIDTIQNETEKAKEVVFVYHRNFSKVHQWQTLQEKYLSYKILLQTDTLAHARTLRYLATTYFFQGDFATYDSLRSASFRINSGEKHFYETIYRDANTYFKAGDFKKCKEYLSQIVPLKERVLANGSFNLVVVDYYNRCISLAFVEKDLTSFQKYFDEFISYFNIHKSKFDKTPRYYQALTHVISLKALLHLERKEKLAALHTMIEGIEKGHLNLKQTKGIAANFYAISSLIYQELDEKERADWAKNECETLITAGEIHPYFEELYEGLSAKIEEDWKTVRQNAEKMQDRIQQNPNRFGSQKIDYYSLLVDYYIGQSELDSALVTIAELIEVNTAKDLLYIDVYCNMKQGEVYQLKKNYEKALFYLEQAREQSEQLDHTGFLYDINEQLLAIANTIDDKTLLMKAQNELLVLQSRIEPYRTDKLTNLEYLAVSRKLILKDGYLEKQNNKNLRVFAIFLMIVLFLLSGLSYKKQQDNKQKKEKLEKTIVVLQKEKKNISNKLQKIKDKNHSTEQLLSKLNESINSDSWEDFKIFFQVLHPDYIPNIVNKFPRISATQQMHAMCLKMGLTIKETASLLHVSERTVKDTRWRMKKLMDLPPEIRVSNFLQQF